MLLLTVGGKGAFAQRSLSGTVVDTTGSAITGATVTIKGTSAKTLTDDRGRFTLREPEPTGTLIISHLGHQSITEKFDTTTGIEFHFTLVPTDNLLEEVEVSTGYRILSKERATGSFVHIDNQLLSRSVGSNVLDRLRGVTRGLIFNDVSLGSNLVNQSGLSIRGRSTLEANAEPLVILDNFPYEGDINAINPEDIESVTVLQDAAAASIWGARAGNGVIVLTSKTGRFDQPLRVSASANTSISAKPDLYYAPTMPTAELIELERFLFNQGAWDGTINQGFSYITPAVEYLLAHRNGHLDSMGMESQLALLKTRDVRPDLLKYLYRPSGLGKMAVQLDGGSAANRYYVSAGYDNNRATVRNSATERISLTARNSYRMLNDRLSLDASVLFSKTNGEGGNAPQYGMIYNRLADGQGNPLSIGGGYNSSGLRQSYIDTAGGGRLLDWNYRPIDELYSNQIRSDHTAYQIQGGITYQPLKWLSGKVNYQYGVGQSAANGYQLPGSYAVRHDINRFSQINPATGTVSSAIPAGGRLDRFTDNHSGYHFRGQLDVHKEWGESHRLDVLAGAEWNHRQTLNETSGTWHGYQPETESYTVVDLTAYHPQYHSYDWYTIPGVAAASRLTTVDRNRLYFGNLSYAWRQKYILTGSLRKDESNLFGVDANNRGRPFWSAGLLWRVDQEQFYRFTWLPKLAVRITQGTSGNISKTASAYVTAIIQNNNSFSLQHPSRTIINPPNPALTWEQVKMVNVAVDFAAFNHKLSGSVEYYHKTASRLLSSVPYHPSSGISTFYGNWSSMRGAGWDINLSTRNLNGSLKWHTDLLFSLTSDRVTAYRPNTENGDRYLIASIGSYPIVGKPVYPLFSFPWAGLNNEGRPRGYLNGAQSTDYAAIYTGTNVSDLQYHGRATPAAFGSIRNGFSFREFSLSFNVTFKWGYYFRRQGLSYSALYNVHDFGSAAFLKDYRYRWKQPGDERTTQVPAAVYPADGYSDAFYQFSGVLVERGDHIRLNDLRIAYDLSLPVGILRSAQLYLYINNIGLLWRANSEGIDPDTVPGQGMTYPNPRTYAFGINIKM